MRIIEQIFRILAPSDCLGCGNEGSLLCAWCVDERIPESQPRCYQCNALTSKDWICATCRPKTALTHLWIRTEHTDTARRLVHTMKFSYSGEAADLIAAELVNTIPSLWPDTIVVHVPTITSHVRQRGFDHTKRMAHQFAALIGREHHTVLGRIGQHRQVGSSRDLRLSEVTKSFRIRSPYLLTGKPVILVDDVLTTGATLDTAARVLKQAGAKRVDAVVFARAK